MPDRDPALEPFDALIGTWATEAEHRMVDEAVFGTTTFEWLEDGLWRMWRGQPGFDQRFPAKLEPDVLEGELPPPRPAQAARGVSWMMGITRFAFAASRR